MRPFDNNGHRLYLTADERTHFLDAATQETRGDRVFCHLLHYTGCRLAEALELAPDRIFLSYNSRNGRDRVKA
ncbi:MAG: hypothetical protein RNU03_01315 [Candidatus Sedimenticola sp. (ex Thyasira tokunagai)]